MLTEVRAHLGIFQAKSDGSLQQTRMAPGIIMFSIKKKSKNWHAVC